MEVSLALRRNAKTKPGAAKDQGTVQSVLVEVV
jgi:hypothetical protein